MQAVYKRIGTGIVASPAVRPSWGQSSPNDRINMAIVGIASRGVFHYNQFQRIPNVRISHLCDVDERLFPANVAALEKSQGRRPKTVVDFRKIVETPFHWCGQSLVDRQRCSC